MSDLETQRAQLATTLATLRERAESNGGAIQNLEAAVGDVMGQLKSINASVAAWQSMALDSQAGGSDESAVYVLSQDEYGQLGANVRSIAGDQPAVYKNDAGAVRILGTSTPVSFKGEAYSYFSWGLADDPKPKSGWQREFQRKVQTRSVVRNLLRPERRFTPRMDAEITAHMRAGPAPIAKMFADSTGIGAEWIPDRTLPELERDVLARTNFTGVFDQRDTGPGGTIKLPYKSGYLRVYKHAVPTGDDPADDVLSSWTTAERTIDPVHAAIAIQADRDATEDSIIPIVPEIVADMISAYQYADDDCWTNGDTAGTHQDDIANWDPRGRLGGTTGLGGSNDHRRRWRGLRAYAADISQTTDQGSAQTAAGLLTALTSLDMAHLIESDGISRVVVAVSPEYFFKTMLTWDEFETFDKAGAFASILTGLLGNTGATPGGMLPNQVGFLWGRFPVVLNYALTGDMNASGVFDNVTTTKTGLLVFDRTRFQTWLRMGMSVESEVNIRNHTTTWVARRRVVGRNKSADADSPQDVHYSYNLTG